MFWSNAVATTNQGGFVVGLGQSYLVLLFGLGMIILFGMRLAGSLLDLLQPKHRGITHKKSTGLVLSGLVAAGVFYVLQHFLTQVPALVLGAVMGLANYLGILSHLRLDELID
jgi:hypothetical protein